MSKKATATNKVIHDYLKEKVEQLDIFNKAGIDKKVAVATVRDLLVIEGLDKTLSKVFSKGW
jgi:hypothetical protein